MRKSVLTLFNIYRPFFAVLGKRRHSCDRHCVQDAPLKVADFGLACPIQPGQKLKETCGTPNYMAPERLCRRPYDEKSDIWSIGVMMYILLAGMCQGRGSMFIVSRVLCTHIKKLRSLFGRKHPPTLLCQCSGHISNASWYWLLGTCGTNHTMHMQVPSRSMAKQTKRSGCAH